MRDTHVLLGLGEARHHGDHLRQRTPVEAAAEEQRRGQAVARDMAVEVDDVPGLLAAEQRALATERLEHVPVADVGRQHPNAPVGHEPVKAEIRHRGHGNGVDAEGEREHGNDLVSVDDLPGLVHREHAVAVAVEGDAEVVGAVAHDVLQEGEVGRTAAHVDVRAVGRVRNRRHVRAEPLEDGGGDGRIRAVGAVDRDPEAGELGAEMLDEVLHVAVGGGVCRLDGAAALILECRATPRSPPRRHL